MKLTSKFPLLNDFIKLLCGIFMVITVMHPWLELPAYDFAEYALSFSQQAQEASSMGKSAAEDSRRAIIKETVASYILDKATSLGMEIAVEVDLSEDERAVPCGAVIHGEVSAVQKRALQQYLEEELDIRMEDQQWTG